MNNLSEILKQSRALVAFVKALREIPEDFHACGKLLSRKKEIERYLRDHVVRKLHLGCGANILDEWLNTDYSPKTNGVSYQDAKKPFPFSDCSIDFIFTEHMIEHIPFANGQMMLSECRRTLTPGGTIRISTPNLAMMAALLNSPLDPESEYYVKTSSKKYIPENVNFLPGFVMNNFYWDFGHYFIYDPDTMAFALESAGFGDVKRVKSGESESPDLCGLERHATVVGAELDSFETMIFEAQRP